MSNNCWFSYEVIEIQPTKKKKKKKKNSNYRKKNYYE